MGYEILCNHVPVSISNMPISYIPLPLLPSSHSVLLSCRLVLASDDAVIFFLWGVWQEKASPSIYFVY